jgi:hypothetical protein
MRLVDADLIEKQFDSNTWQGEMMIAIARGLPTAYDVGKVVEKLAEKIEDNIDIDTGERCDNWFVDVQNELIEECIDIVKAGGKDE